MVVNDTTIPPTEMGGADKKYKVCSVQMRAVLDRERV